MKHNTIFIFILLTTLFLFGCGSSGGGSSSGGSSSPIDINPKPTPPVGTEYISKRLTLSWEHPGHQKLVGFVLYWQRDGMKDKWFVYEIPNPYIREKEIFIQKLDPNLNRFKMTAKIVNGTESDYSEIITYP